jgi:hypothetical protein
MNSVREAFEKRNPVSADVKYCKDSEKYTHFSSSGGLSDVWAYNRRWNDFRDGAASMQEEIDRLNTELKQANIWCKVADRHAKESRVLQAEVKALKESQKWINDNCKISKNGDGYAINIKDKGGVYVEKDDSSIAGSMLFYLLQGISEPPKTQE